MLHTKAFSRFLVSLLIGSVLFCWAIGSLGQSGRRASKPPPPPVIEVEPVEKPVTPAPKPKLRLLLNVGMDQRGGLSNFPLYYYAEAQRALIERLRQDSSVGVKAAGAMTRGDAVKAAKAEQEGYVVYLQLRSENMSSSGREDANAAVLEYWVLAPTTAKLVTSGNTYARDYQNRSILRPNSSVYDNRLLNLAAKNAAERILDHFDKPTGRKLPSPFRR